MDKKYSVAKSFKVVPCHLTVGKGYKVVDEQGKTRIRSEFRVECEQYIFAQTMKGGEI